MDTVPIWKQRRIVTVFIDALAALVLLYVGQFATPDVQKLVAATWGILQLPVIALIAAFTVDNTQLVKAGFVRTKQGIQPLVGPKTK